MRRVLITATLLAFAIAIAGCAKGLTEEQANAVLQGLAGELLKLEGAKFEPKMAAVKIVCEKEGVEIDAFARYLDEHPDADGKLGELMQKAFEAELAAMKKDDALEIAKVEADAKNAAAGRKAEILGKKQTMENAMQAKIAGLQDSFEKKEAELKATIAEVRKQQ
jgi:hypothetical protein